MRELLSRQGSHICSPVPSSRGPPTFIVGAPPPRYTPVGPAEKHRWAPGGELGTGEHMWEPCRESSRISHSISGRWCSKGTESPSGVRESRRFEQEQHVLSLEPPRLPQGAGSNVPNFGWVRSARAVPILSSRPRHTAPLFRPHHTHAARLSLPLFLASRPHATRLSQPLSQPVPTPYTRHTTIPTSEYAPTRHIATRPTATCSYTRRTAQFSGIS